MKKMVSAVLALLLLLVPLTALCEEDFPKTLTDAAGRTVTLEKVPERIVSGYYISSSLMIALHARDRVCGIETKAASRPVYALTAPEFLSLPDVGSVKSFSLEACLAAEPDLVILPVRLKTVAEELEELSIPALLVDPEDFVGLEQMIALVGDAIGREAEARSLLAYVRQLRDDLTALIAGAEKPGVYLAGNSSWLRTAGSAMYQNSMIGLAGGANVADGIGGGSWADISYEQLIAWDPDVIILAPESAYTVEDVLNDPELSGLKAVREGRVAAMPDTVEAWDSPVPSTLLGSLWMASVLHPDLVTEERWLETAIGFYRDFYGSDVTAALTGIEAAA